MNLISTINRATSGLKHHGFARSVGILTAGTALAYTLSVLTLPIVSRLYSPQDFGVFVLVLSFSTVVSVLASLGLQTAIVRAGSDEDSRRILAATLVLATGIAMLLLVVALILTPFTIRFDTVMSYPAACSLVAMLGLLMSWNGSLRCYANRRGANRILFVNYLLGSITTVVVTVPLGILGVGSIGLIAGSVVAAIACIGQMVARLRPLLLPTVRDIRDVLNSNRGFVYFQYPANLIETVSTEAPRQVLAYGFGSGAVGLFAMTDRILGVPLRMLGAPVGTIYLREASEKSSSGGDLTPFTMKLVVRVMLAAYVPIILVVFWGEPLFVLLLGSQWRDAGALASVLIIQYVFALIRACVGSARVVLGRHSINFFMSLTRLAVSVGALVVGGAITGSAFYALASYSIGSVVFYIVDMTATFRAMGRSHWKYLGFAIVYCLSVAMIWVGVWLYRTQLG